eukprot:TRINITY_DN4899_c0_g1_i1.p1 TRINITY_DN4899_c0_g1~~TRINITY_DN4899_c0_g1_i1.p1  ORF type:complete len:393 (+),score=64.32 TRINITY_DN4899_c0_g1_i1:41-1219(+)
MNFDDLPDHLQCDILKMRNKEERRQMVLVSKAWRNLLSEFISFVPHFSKPRTCIPERFADLQKRYNPLKVINNIKHRVKRILFCRHFYTDIKNVIEACPNLQHVTVKNLKFDILPDIDNSVLPSVQRLILGTDLGKYTFFLQALNHFPNLKHLKTRDNWMTPENEGYRFVHHPLFTKLESLNIFHEENSIEIPLTPNHSIKKIQITGIQQPGFVGSIMDALEEVQSVSFKQEYNPKNILKFKSTEIRQIEVICGEFNRLLWSTPTPYLQVVRLVFYEGLLPSILSLISKLKLLQDVDLMLMNIKQAFPLLVFHGCQFLTSLKIRRYKPDSITAVDDLLNLCLHCHWLCSISFQGFYILANEIDECKKKLHSHFPNRKFFLNIILKELGQLDN